MKKILAATILALSAVSAQAVTLNFGGVFDLTIPDENWDGTYVQYTEGTPLTVSAVYTGGPAATEILVKDPANVTLHSQYPAEPGYFFQFDVTTEGVYQVYDIFAGSSVQFTAFANSAGPTTPEEAAEVLNVAFDEAFANGEITVAETFLFSRVRLIERFLDRGRVVQAMRMLDMFEAEITAQLADGDIEATVAAELLDAAQDLRDLV